MRSAQLAVDLNHKATIEMLVDQADEIGFNLYTMQNLHALLADNLLPDPAAGGRLSGCPIGMTSMRWRAGVEKYDRRLRKTAVDRIFTRISAVRFAFSDNSG